MPERRLGFHSISSSIFALLKVTEDIRRELDGGKLNFLILLDYSKAFDTADHKLLLLKLGHFSIFFFFFDTSTRFLSSYLLNRSKFMHSINGQSTALNLHRGVHQGSLLVLILFAIYINDMSTNSNIKQCMCMQIMVRYT